MKIGDSQQSSALTYIQPINKGSLWSAGRCYANWPFRFCAVLGLMAALYLAFADINQFVFHFLSVVTFCVIFMSALRIIAAFCLPPKLPQSLRTHSDASPAVHLQSSLPPPETEIWPYYTVLVPLHREAHMVPSLMDALEKIDYPRSRLQILMICEESDPGTINAVKAHMRPCFELVSVPYSHPQTKPKALNVALNRSCGDLITIYDAEDRPDPRQLKAAAYALLSDPKLGAVQAPLQYFNAHENRLTRQFALEYAALFYVWNPMLSRFGLPFPLGGTSNHMRGLM